MKLFSKNILRFCLGACVIALGVAPASASEPEYSPGFLVHLLDYLAHDYPGAVQNGKILSASEYEEQKEFSSTSLVVAKKLAQGPAPPANIVERINALQSLILKKASVVEVARVARDTQKELINTYHLSVTPNTWPDLLNAEKVYVASCSSCHGVQGNGAGPMASAFHPAPANFLDKKLRDFSPFQVYNTIRFGVPGTAMQAHPEISDEEAWSIAFFVIGLRYGKTSELSRPERNHQDEIFLKLGPFQDLLTAASLKSDAELEKDPHLAALHLRSADSLLAALRLHSASAQRPDLLDKASETLDASLQLYEKQNYKESKRLAILSYLDGVEPLEAKLKLKKPELVGTIETDMALLRNAIDDRKPLSEVRGQVELSKAHLKEAQKLLATESSSFGLIFSLAAGVLFREGFEAVLMIVALLGVLQAAGAKRATFTVHAGWICAVFVGWLSWFFSGWLLKLSGFGRELLEAIVSLVAVFVLLYLGFWLHRRTEISRWKSFVEGRVRAALESENHFALFAIAFMAVFREAFETVLFLRAVSLESGAHVGWALGLGVLCSFVLVIVLGGLLLKFSAKIPIRKLFSISSIVMIVLAVILAGKGCHAFQESGLVSATPLSNFLPEFFAEFLRWELIGLFPNLQGVIIQSAVLVLGIFLLLSDRIQNNSQKKELNKN